MAAPILDLRKRIEKIDRLPAMPQLAGRIIALKSDPLADVKKLSAIVELDPGLTAQVVRYAQSPYFGYRGKVDSVHTAISRVLGFEVVLHLAFGMATCRPFRLPLGGPLGLKSFWKHAVYAAALTQALSSIQPADFRASAGLAYLAGLLQNFGLLVMGHFFQQEYGLLVKYLDKYPDRPITDIEMRLFGVHHGQVGAWLLQKWGLPEEVVVAARFHHDLQYQGSHEVFPQLVMVSNHILKRKGLGDATDGIIPEILLDWLGFGEYMALLEAKRVLEGNDSLRTMITQCVT